MWHSPLEMDVIFRRDYGKQVSVAGAMKKGKSGRVQKTSRFGHGFGQLVTLAIPQEQNQKDDDREHEPSEVATRRCGATHWNVCHTYVVDTISVRNVC